MATTLWLLGSAYFVMRFADDEAEREQIAKNMDTFKFIPIVFDILFLAALFSGHLSS